MWLTFIGVLLMGIFVGAVDGVLGTYYETCPIYCHIGHREDYAGVNPADYKWNGSISVNTPLNWLGNGKSRTDPGCRYYYGAGDYNRNSLFQVYIVRKEHLCRGK